ncbi:5-bromo-4-chloroindolyl phosphate hydrolysis protein [Limimaricola soesokkakensis]|uniref:5-bromo-4-chloroindolyl phosphate hydrolysis protein n=1 Tax=Limimaricola soesokkakensis TaxID=1343159 RepID=A0A1X6Y860_9RHOB|nr:5-bromo-4-chloroindolyl phosphate hydrolysis family protein [Limimaricola soesokkakensis]PSK87273.1 5-bromo-4-chloroindolyl phosphate hydrolysis protein [Limimaricola soesokkakensis]SLN12832.1 5-bromo-4-chloroindolyl phosphate hydrolysis protein [Limimaricola soesokkakensis]
MARRFGGRYSPGQQGGPAAPDPRDTARVDPAGARVNLLFVPPALLALFSLGAGPAGLVAGLLGAGVLTAAAFLLRDGLRAEAEWRARPVARRPAWPRKMMASALTGVGVALAAWSGDGGVIGAALYGIAAAGLHVAAFGIDPLSDKRIEGVDDHQQDRVAKVVDEAESYLAQMREAIAGLRDRRLDERVAAFQARAREMIRTVERDPRDLTQARRYLGVYLMGARDASVKFADLWSRNRDSAARAEYESLLTDLDRNFAARTETMLLSDRTDMDIEIRVLRDRLAREGVVAKSEEGNE